tara:strand:+ start:636 stop:863 length:228 start_codon:yes stop_codon:yes gene_type:complete
MFTLTKIPKKKLIESMKQLGWRESFVVEKANIEKILDPITGEIHPYNKDNFKYLKNSSMIKSKEAYDKIYKGFKN